ncbi:HNH endonuclease [Burkholderia ambifaria]|uniref:HNH endonuclease n=1 Tax=Burkholderia ambifaria TaxID=152480 RepID=UPI001E5F1280|nr:HNH endonuclease signature motif containing protein [Burkholderia ambifaria]UEP23130.1 HNH endonuclease [Burkholderia ambifaria]
MVSARKPLGKKTRFDVFKRDMFSCVYCGGTPPGAVLEIDHVVPVSQGGDNSLHNLVTSCFDCNRGKGAESLSAIPETLASRAEVVAEKLAQIQAYERLIKRAKKVEERQIDEVETAFNSNFPDYWFKPKFRESVRAFLKTFTADDLIGFMHLAASRTSAPDPAIKYFCGICWRKIREAS